MIKAVLFDLDGVLVKTKQLHFEALNQALEEVGPDFCITPHEHITTYDGLKTTAKLAMLSERKGLPERSHAEVWDRKQEITKELCEALTPVQEHIDLFRLLRREGYKIAVCSNAIHDTTVSILERVGLIDFCENVFSNQDVVMPKPHPEMYWAAMTAFQVLPEETLIVEDSPPGLMAAERSGAHVVRVECPEQVNRDFIFSKIDQLSRERKFSWKDKKMNVLIPMAGAGTRFERAGYTFPKPLIEVGNKPMIQLVVESLGIDAHYIFIVQKSHREKYNLDLTMNLISPGCTIVEVDGITEGAACTTLLAKEFIDNDSPLVIANSDQYVEWDAPGFFYMAQEQLIDGGILTFKSTHPKWSFAKTDQYGRVLEVAEKNPISDNATVGVYYWRRGSDYVKYAEQMIEKNIRVNNEFYVCPVYNEAILDEKFIKIYEVEGMHGLGTPEDLQAFLTVRGVDV